MGLSADVQKKEENLWTAWWIKCVKMDQEWNTWNMCNDSDLSCDTHSH